MKPIDKAYVGPTQWYFEKEEEKVSDEPLGLNEAIDAIVAKIKANESPATKEKAFQEWQKKAPPFTQTQLREWRKYAQVRLSKGA